MRKQVLALSIVLAMALTGTASALTGLGLGIRGGIVTGFENKALDRVVQLVDSTAALDSKMTMLGAHLKIGTLPVLDFEFAGEVAWHKTQLTNKLDFTVADVGLIGSAKYNFNTPMVRPYIGAGVGLHIIVYAVDVYDLMIIIPEPDTETKLAYHGLGGLSFRPPAFPLEFFVEGKYTYVTTRDEPTKYATIFLGATLNLL